MRTLNLGKTDIAITPVIMGTWQAGKQMWHGIEDTQTIKAMRAAFDAGITTFDTATVYGSGHSERIVAEALGSVRHEAVYATKVFPNKLAYDKLIASCEQSLRDLNTDYIDLYQIHWPAGAFGSKKVPIEESMRALDDLKQQGKIRAIGVSNFNREQIAEASEFGRIDSLQPPYSLLWRHTEEDALPWCRENKVTILAYSPMAQGILTGKFGANPIFEKGDHRSANRLFQPPHWDRIQDALKKLEPIAQRHDATLGQLALAWVMAGENSCAIAGARNAEQVKQNAGAADISLTEEDLQEMDGISKTVTDHIDDNPVLWNF